MEWAAEDDMDEDMVDCDQVDVAEMDASCSSIAAQLSIEHVPQ